MADETQSSVTNSQTLVLPIDPEPTALRAVLLAILLIGVIIGYFLTSALFGIQSCSILGVLGGLAVGAISIQVAERFLKPRWQSNRLVRLNYAGVEIVKNGLVQVKVDPTQEIDVHLWRFEVPRRHRVPKGWYVVAIALEQSQVYLPVFTLASPEYFEQLPLARHFTKLTSRKEMEQNNQSNLRLAGQQRRLLKAEGARNLDGVEMLNPDFETYLDWLTQNFPEWMPSA